MMERFFTERVAQAVILDSEQKDKLEQQVRTRSLPFGRLAQPIFWKR
jgi:hypothetical protein